MQSKFISRCISIFCLSMAAAISQEEPHPEPNPDPPVTPTIYTSEVTTRVSIKDQAAMLRRCDAILDDKYGLSAAERRALLYIEDVPQLQRCIELIVIDALSPAHLSLEMQNTVVQRS